MEELNIQLTFSPEYFREIYYMNGQGSVFTYQPTKKAITITFVLAIITVVIYFVSVSLPTISWLIIVAVISIIGSLFYTITVLVKYLKWKNKTEKYIKEISKYKKWSLHVTDNSIEISFDTQSNIDKWENIKAAHLENNYIHLFNKNQPDYFFPSKSMKKNEFERFTAIVRDKIK